LKWKDASPNPHPGLCHDLSAQASSRAADSGATAPQGIRDCYPLFYGLRFLIADNSVNGRPAMKESSSHMPTRLPPQKNPTVTRRDFFRGAAIAGAAFLGAPALLRAKSLNDKLNLVIIGCGGRGAANMAEMLAENIVALCDVNESNLLKAAAKA